MPSFQLIRKRECTIVIGNSIFSHGVEYLKFSCKNIHAGFFSVRKKFLRGTKACPICLPCAQIFSVTDHYISHLRKLRKDLRHMLRCRAVFFLLFIVKT